MIWFIASLIPSTALMMGAVHPWAFKATEEFVLALVMVWAARIALGKCSFSGIDPKLRFPFIVSLLLLGTVAAQLVPLPVPLEKIVSPSTYRLYELSLPGWPRESPYSWLYHEQMIGGDAVDTPGQLSKDGGSDSTNAAAKSLAEGGLRRTAILRLPISIAPSLTKVALLKLLTCALLSFLIVFYPFPGGDPRKRNIYQILIRVLFATGLLVGFIGLLEEFFPNGKPLWIFTPYDFRGEAVWGMRAFGPFANPDHFACFLAMLLPPAASGIFYPGMLGKVRERAAVPLLSGVVVVVLTVVLLATASRGGMLNALTGIIVLGWLFLRLPAGRQPALFREGKSKHFILATGAAVLVVMTIYLAGSSNRALAASRLNATFASESFSARLVPAEDTVRMIADFPLFGVGLGAWPDLYRKYARPPWSPIFMNAAHNEYIQFLAETGLVGFLLAAATVLTLVWWTSSRISDLPIDQFAVIASFIASLAGLAAHAAFDFPLRIPAIATLATIMSAAIIRAAFHEPITTKVVRNPDAKVRFGAAAATMLVMATMWIVARQQQIPYPYDLMTPLNYSQMAQLLLAHPANSRIHLTLIGLEGPQTSQGIRLTELKTAVSLEPNNPIARDLYLQALARDGQSRAALTEMAKSVFYAPSASDHFYLSSEWVPKLTEPETHAIEKGLNTATKDGFEVASITLGDFYHELGKFREEGGAFANAAQQTSDTDDKAELLIRAGHAFAQAGDSQRAIDVLRQAIDLRPDKSDAYETLALVVYVPRSDFASARSAINQGIKAGADSAKLYLRLAAVNRAADDRSGEEEALNRVAAEEPLSFDITYSLGTAYLNDGRTDEAVLWLRKAAQANPGSAGVLFLLAQVEELDYQFFAAQNDYTKALALEPDNVSMRSRFQQFKERVAANSRSN